MGMDRISQGSISFSEENLDFMIKKLPKDRFVNFSTISIGAKHHVPGMAMTVLKGGGARVGMEDNIYYAPGELLKSNAQMVERAVRIIRELGIRHMRLMTNNPLKRAGLEGYGLCIDEIVPIVIAPNPYNAHYLETKQERMHHTLGLEKR